MRSAQHTKFSNCRFSNPGLEQFHFGEISILESLLVDVDHVMKCLKIFLCQMQAVLGGLHIDKCALHVKHNAAYGIQ